MTWFRVGGPADLLFSPADADDLALFLRACPSEAQLRVLGAGSNVLIRDGGLRGVTLRLSARFAAIQVDPIERLLIAGAAARDRSVADTALRESVEGFSFYRGIPGTIGGAITMNAGCLGSETAERLTEVTAMTLSGKSLRLSAKALHLSYRHSSPPEPLIYLSAHFRAERASQEAIQAKMSLAEQHRERQPIRERTGGSTFRNPPHESAWALIDQAGCRGLVYGDAQVSTQHCNFLINRGNASAEDIETLGEMVRARVKRASGVTLRWEILRLGERAVCGSTMANEVRLPRG